VTAKAGLAPLVEKAEMGVVVEAAQVAMEEDVEVQGAGGGGGGDGGDGGDGGWAKVTNAEASQKFAKPKGKTNQAFLVRFLTLKDGIKDFRHGAVVLPMVVAIIINHCT
jgi:hypothetical protein